MTDLAFTSLNGFAGLQYLEARSAEELLTQLRQIKSMAQIISIYAVGTRHIAWLKMDGKIVKKQKQSKEIKE